METLADRIALTGKLEVAEAVTLAARLALWIEQLHAADEVHGALSPDAIVLRDRDIRRAALRSAFGAPSSPSYFSPERLAGQSASPEDDTWAIGALLYAALTGHQAFAGATSEKVAARIRSGAAAPLAVFDVGDDDIGDIVHSVLAVEPSDRVSTVPELRRALEAWLEKRGLAIGPMMDTLDDEPEVKLDLASLPPPPKLDGSPAHVPEPSSPLKETLDEDTTLPREERPRPAVPRQRPLPAVAKQEVKPPSASAELGERLPPTSELLARAKKATTRPPPRLNPPKALQSSRPPALSGSSRPLPPLTPPPKPSPAPSARPSAPVLPLAGLPSTREMPSFDSDRPGTPAAKEVPSASREDVRAQEVRLVAAPAKRGGIGVVTIVVVIAAVVVGGYAVVRLMARPSPTSEGAPPSAEAAPTAQISAPPKAVLGASSLPSAAPVPTPSVSTSSAAAATAPPVAQPVAAPLDEKACFVSLLAEGSVAEDAHPDFGFVCKDADPRKAASKVRSLVIVAAHGRVTDAMREWSMLGYWELATYAAMRGHCCPNASPIELPPSPGACPSLAEALNAVSTAAHTGTSETAQADAAKGFRDALQCVVKSGQQGYLGEYPAIAGGQDSAFMKTLARTRK